MCWSMKKKTKKQKQESKRTEQTGWIPKAK